MPGDIGAASPALAREASISSGVRFLDWRKAMRLSSVEAATEGSWRTGTRGFQQGCWDEGTGEELTGYLAAKSASCGEEELQVDVRQTRRGLLEPCWGRDERRFWWSKWPTALFSLPSYNSRFCHHHNTSK